VDTIAPKFGNILTQNKRFAEIAVSDQLSGIVSYEADIAGVWVVVEYHPNMKKLRIWLDEFTSSGPISVAVKISDAAGNTAVKQFTF
jgi:hypothetical protein